MLEDWALMMMWIIMMWNVGRHIPGDVIAVT